MQSGFLELPLFAALSRFSSAVIVKAKLDSNLYAAFDINSFYLVTVFCSLSFSPSSFLSPFPSLPLPLSLFLQQRFLFFES